MIVIPLTWRKKVSVYPASVWTILRQQSVKQLLGEENKGFFRIENLELNFPAYDFLLYKLSKCSNCNTAYISIQEIQYSY